MDSIIVHDPEIYTPDHNNKDGFLGRRITFMPYYDKNKCVQEPDSLTSKYPSAYIHYTVRYKAMSIIEKDGCWIEVNIPHSFTTTISSSIYPDVLGNYFPNHTNNYIKVFIPYKSSSEGIEDDAVKVSLNNSEEKKNTLLQGNFVFFLKYIECTTSYENKCYNVNHNKAWRLEAVCIDANIVSSI